MAPPGPPRAVERRRAASRAVSSGADDVHLDHPAHPREVHVGEAGARRHDAGVGDDVGDRAERRRGTVEEAVTSSSRVTSPRIATARPDAAAVASAAAASAR